MQRNLLWKLFVRLLIKNGLFLFHKVIDNSVLRERIGNFLRDMDFDAFTFEQNEEIWKSKSWDV